ncbi:peptidoglycan endopeptidase [Flavobacterium algicola]|uniref:peptidoglycan endopeptidase n=1 Tax=Flavobacterium algicola TaxID=556529 RepID=UPI001EFE2FD5|nr:peptidoglycan endopeptidase [Flavobacterium algicola]MCG9791199.1 LysM peptidoglycan-binding domain-containing protein [Flavobacterium algicola]
MKCYSWILMSVSLIGFTAFSQQKTTEHIVSKGETISKIAKQYNVSIKEIFELNPEAKNGIRIQSSLLIPIEAGKSSSSSSSSEVVIHEVIAKESPYSISRKYNISVDELYKSNPSIKDGGLQIGQKITILGAKIAKTDSAKPELIPLKKQDVAELSKSNFEGIEYEVAAKQTKYSIAKDYGITVALLDKANPILLTEDLKVGQKILIPVKKFVPNQDILKKELPAPKVAEVAKVEKVAAQSESKVVNQKEAATTGVDYEVVSKETKYSIAKDHGISVAMLDQANPILQTTELKVGQKIVIPVKAYVPELQEKVKAVAEVKTEAPVLKEKPSIQKTPSISEPTSVTQPTVAIAEVEHEVLAKQTKYGIAKEYGITVAELDKANSFFDQQSLQIGQKLIIPSKNGLGVVVDRKQLAPQEVVVSTTEDNKAQALITHVVLPKETKYGIANDFGISVKELEKLNPKIKNKLIVGSTLTIQAATAVNIPADIKQKNIATAFAEEESSSSRYSVDFADRLIDTASDNIGTRYRMGGTTKAGFDCSGLMCVTYGAHDIQLPRTSLEQSRYGTVVEIDSAQKGDLIFFKTRGGRQINHVGMVVESLDGDVKFIHASNSGVIISSIKESYYAKRVAQVNRVL